MENISTAVVCAIILAICVYAVISYRKKLKNGCCGGGGELKVKPADRNKSNYSYKTDVYIEGMTCGRCAERMENAFNRQEGFLAKVHLHKGCAEVWTKAVPDEKLLKNTVEKAGYTFVKAQIKANGA